MHYTLTCLVQSDKMDRARLTRLFVLLFLINTTGWFTNVAVDASQVTLTNNGYKKLVVAISSETPADQSDLIISNIKVFHQIFHATKRVYYIDFFTLENDFRSLPGPLQGD